MSAPSEEDWKAALRRAALPGAVRIEYGRAVAFEDGVTTIRHALHSFDEAGAVIGDDRDYDLLKAAMTPLETLGEREDERNFILALDLVSGELLRRNG